MLGLIFTSPQKMKEYVTPYYQMAGNDLGLGRYLKSERELVRELILVKPLTISRSPWKVIYLATADQIMQSTRGKRAKISFADGSSVVATILQADTTTLVWQYRSYKTNSDTMVTPLAEIKELSVRRGRLGGGVRYLAYGALMGGFAGGPGPGAGEGSYNETAFESGVLTAGFVGFVGAIFCPPIGILFPGSNVYLHQEMAWGNDISFEQVLQKNTSHSALQRSEINNSLSHKGSTP